MKNWQDYVKIQKGINDTSKVFYLTLSEDKEIKEIDGITVIKLLDQYKINLLSTDVVCDLQEYQVGDYVENVLYGFPSVQCISPTDIQREINMIALKTKRGRANINYNNVWYYMGNASYDSPIIVIQYEDKYGVFIHPQFENYGFVIV
jgi:hypothetical protein